MCSAGRQHPAAPAPAVALLPPASPAVALPAVALPAVALLPGLSPLPPQKSAAGCPGGRNSRASRSVSAVAPAGASDFSAPRPPTASVGGSRRNSVCT
jgi:hypothetical protein